MVMDRETRAAFVAHVRKLQQMAVECEDEERRCDAIRSLACMALLCGEPGGPGGGGEVIDLVPYLKLAA